jgi:hypothetical protein
LHEGFFQLGGGADELVLLLDGFLHRA